MSTFYSDLAKSAGEELGEKSALGSTKKANSSYFNDDNEDLDDLLDNLNFSATKKSESFANKSENLSTKNVLNPSPEFKNVPDEYKNEFNSSINKVKEKKDIDKSRQNLKSRKSVLDQLIEPFAREDEFKSQSDLEHNENSLPFKNSDKDLVLLHGDKQSSRHSSNANSGLNKRSVRFSDSVKVDLLQDQNGFEISDSQQPKVDQRPNTGDHAKPPQNSANRLRPHTAPGPSSNVKLSLENLLLDESSPEPSRQVDEMDEFAKSFQSARARARRPSSLDSVNRSGDMMEFTTKGSKDKRLSGSVTNFAFGENMSAPVVNADLEAKLKRVEMEKKNAEAMLQLMKKQHQEELSVVEQAAKSKLELIEESAKRRESRLKNELQYLEEQSKERLIQLEQQRDQLVAELSGKLNEARQQSAQELTRMKTFHDDELKALKFAHEQAVDQIKSACQQETRVKDELQPNMEQLKRLLESLTNAALELSRAEQDRVREASVRHEQLARREDALRLAEERLTQREEELDQERKLTTDILAKLEVQLKENAKLTAEDRWSIKQEHNRLAKLQTGLEEERRGVVEQAGRERAEIHQLVSNFLTEHRKLQSRNSEERALIAADQQKLRAEQMSWEETRRAEESRLRQVKEEVDAIKDALAAERRCLDERANKIRIDEVKLEETRRQLDIVRRDLAREQESLNNRNEYVTQQMNEVSHRAETVAQAERALNEAEARQRKLQIEQSKQFTELQLRVEKMHEAETKLMMERRELAREHAELTRLRHELGTQNGKAQVLCANCQVPVREHTPPTTKSRLRTDSALRTKSRKNAASHEDLRAPVMDEQILRKLRASQEEDAQFLAAEKRYLQRIKQATNELIAK